MFGTFALALCICTFCLYAILRCLAVLNNSLIHLWPLIHWHTGIYFIFPNSYGTVPFRIVRHGLWPMTTAPKFYFGRGQCDAWFWPNFGELKFRPGILKLEFSANALSQPAKDNVTCDYAPISAPSKGPVTRAMPNNSKWYSILLSDLFDDIYKFINLHLGAVFFFLVSS